MPSSGVKIAEEVINTYSEIKMEKKYSYAVFTIQDQKLVTLEETGPGYPGGKNAPVTEETSREHFEQLRQSLKAKDGPRYVVFDCRMDANKDKLVFIFWSPDTCGPGKKMIFASTKDGVTKKMEGLGCKCELHDDSELEFDNVKAAK